VSWQGARDDGVDIEGACAVWACKRMPEGRPGVKAD